MADHPPMYAVTDDELKTKLCADFYRSILKAATILPPIQATPLLKIYISRDDSVKVACKALEIAGKGHILKPISKISDINDICHHIIDEKFEILFSDEHDRIVLSAVLILKLLWSAYDDLAHPEMHVDPDVILRHGFILGYTTLSLRLDLAGMKTAEKSMRVVVDYLASMRAAASRGGIKGTKKRVQKSELWKQAALESAKKLTSGRKRWSREQLATEIVQHPGVSVGQRTVVNWLKYEAEEPNGPIKRR